MTEAVEFAPRSFPVQPNQEASEHACRDIRLSTQLAAYGALAVIGFAAGASLEHGLTTRAEPQLARLDYCLKLHPDYVVNQGLADCLNGTSGVAAQRAQAGNYTVAIGTGQRQMTVIRSKVAADTHFSVKDSLFYGGLLSIPLESAAAVTLWAVEARRERQADQPLGAAPTVAAETA